MVSRRMDGLRRAGGTSAALARALRLPDARKGQMAAVRPQFDLE